MDEIDTQGFTLIELLVTIAVVSALIAILLPALHRARVLTKRTICQSNLRQIAQAWHMYLDDYEGKFYQGRNADVAFAGWQGARPSNKPRPLNTYLSLPVRLESESQARVVKCPADDGRTEGSGLPAYTRYGTSYRINQLITYSTGDGLPSVELTSRLHELTTEELSIDQIDNPSRLILLGDFDWVNQWWPTYPEKEGWHGRLHHFNLSFLDGHVAFLEIHKGIYVADEYVVLPFEELYGLAREVQEEQE